VGAPECGDVMRLQIRVNPETQVIEEAKFKTFGCGSAIASSSLATEWVKGRTVTDALGIRNILIATGDAPKRGTYPSRAVFDLNSIELIGLIKKMNNGLDYNDKPFQGQTRLCISATARPGARDLEADIERTRQKAAAGADFIQTQPIFHADKARLFMNAVKDLKIPVIMGIMPLRNLRTAELMDKSVPGITIPPEFMEAIATSEQAMIDATCRLITEIYPLVGGIHVMAMGDIEVSNILIEHIRSLGKPDTVSFLS